VAIEFLSDDQAAAYGRFTGPPERAELERFFFLDDADRALVGKRRGDHNRLGFSLQLGTARFIGLFLPDPLDVPPEVVDYLAGQLGIADASSVKRYAERQSTQWEHAAEIRQAYGYRDFTDDGPQQEIRAFIAARAWTRTEGPRALFDQSVAWLRGQKILLPGASILARLVSEVRNSEQDRLHQVIASAAADADAGLPRRLVGLLDVPDGSRVSEMERLRRSPVRASAPQMVRSLDRASELLAIGAGKADLTGVPANRVEALARYGLGTKAPTLRGLTEPRRTATLLAATRSLEVSAVDDVLDLFTLLMATKLLAWAERESNKQRQRDMPRLARASVTLAKAARVLLAADVQAVTATELWAAVEQVASRDKVASAIEAVEELAPFGEDDDDDADRRAELVKRYATVRPFLPMLTAVVPFGSTDAGAPVLAAARSLPDLAGRKRVRASEVDGALVAGSWRRLVLANPDLPAGAVDHRAYALCVLEQLHRALRRRDVFATGSVRWGDPRARLLSGEEWESARPQALTALRLEEPASIHLAGLGRTLDVAWRGLATRLAESGQADGAPQVRLEPDADGKIRIRVSPLEAVPEPPSLVALRDLVARMLPRVDLPELLLEVDAWTGFTSEFTHLAESGTRMEDLAVSACAVLVAEACNIGFTPVTKPGVPALTRDRLSHVEQNYVRADTISTANARLIEHQAQIGLARLWGGGLVASADGLRFVVPVQTLNAAPNPKYFGQKHHGLTWLNAINDQVAGIGAVVVPGTMRDSLYILDVLLNLDGGPKPELVATDNASYSDIVFGLFRLLGYQFSPRIADLSDQRFWRLEVPGVPPGDYGSLNALARHKVTTTRMTAHWADMQRVAASLAMGTVRAYDLLRMLGRDGSPTPLGHALADYGKIAKTLHLLAMCDPDESYRRTVHVQLTVQESRHRLARKIFHGQRGELRQRYREGQEDQLSALGLVLNAVTLWNTRYSDAAVAQLRAQGYPVDDADAARLSPLVDKHVNVLGRYTFTQPAAAGLRPLRDPSAADPDED
jgi:TnpA family transposase